MRRGVKHWAIVVCAVALSGCVLTSRASTPEGAVRQALANGGSCAWTATICAILRVPASRSRAMRAVEQGAPELGLGLVWSGETA